MFYLIDKPLWMSSFDVVRKLRKVLNIRKIGYLWTLDPLASGCLLVATLWSTKLLSLLEKSEKTYLFEVRIDGTSESLDAGTDISPVDITHMQYRTPWELEDFLLSQVSQIPPKYSALHIGGVRAYELAREGKEVVIPSRIIQVWSVEILECSPPHFRIRMRISSGGYVRSFAPIIWEFFGVSWGYISSLRRECIHLAWTNICVHDAQSLDSFSGENPISYQTIFPEIGVVELSEQEYEDILVGKKIQIHDNSHIEWWKYFLQYSNGFCSLSRVESGFFVVEKNGV